MIYKCETSLHVYSENLSVEAISSELRVKPDRALIMGERVSPRNPRSRMHRGSTWIRSSVIEGERCAELSFEDIAGFVHENLERLLSLDGCEISIRVGIFSEDWQANFALPNSALRRLAGIDVDVLVSVYAGSQDN